jgi:hypothetical protein
METRCVFFEAGTEFYLDELGFKWLIRDLRDNTRVYTLKKKEIYE